MIPLAAQAPPGWNQRTALGSDIPGPGVWYGAGAWAGDHQPGAATLTDSLGLGNALTGGGLHLEAGYRGGGWDLAAEVLGNRTPEGQSYATLYRSHLWYRGETGWQGGFEQEPLVWGYGLNGGYALGEAARPFPRLRVESPMADLHLGRVPLGTWGWQAFMGRMDNHPVLSSSLQNPSWTNRAIAARGTPEAPFLMGYRVQAEFGPLMEFYLNLVDMWGGTRNGRAMTSGYGLGNYVTSMLGIKDAVSEANTDYSAGDPMPTNVGKSMSASELDTGFRLQAPLLARGLGAEKVYLYVSRGSKSAGWPVGVFMRNPLHYLGKDVSFDADNLGRGHWGTWWTNQYRYTAPTLQQPNDTIGILAAWPAVRAGLEYFACVDSSVLGARPFTHSVYVTGFYYYGDPLGNAVGGEAIATTAKLEVDFTPRLTGATTVIRGFRPFRDYLVDWQQDHPGADPVKNRFTVLQQCLAWKASAAATLELGASWQRQSAELNVPGADLSSLAWFADLDLKWPARR